MERGTTLLELVLVLLIFGLGTGASLSFARTMADAAAVRSSREAVLTLAHRAKSEARRSGGATLVIDEGGSVEVLTGPGIRIEEMRAEAWGVEIEIGGSRTRAELRFGPRGIAAFASTTLTLRRGKAEGVLVISSQGRVRR